MVRIPSSLKWLLTRRARLMGDKRKLTARLPGVIAKIELELMQAQQRLESCTRRLMIAKQHGAARIKLIEHDLATIDNTIRLHDIGIAIDPELLRPIKTQEKGRVFSHGELTRSILQALKYADGSTLTTTEIALIVAQNSGLEFSTEDLQGLRLSVRYRLKNLALTGDVQRMPTAKTSRDGRWAEKAA
jgi:hypothetical protein